LFLGIPTGFFLLGFLLGCGLIDALGRRWRKQKRSRGSKINSPKLPLLWPSKPKSMLEQLVVGEQIEEVPKAVRLRRKEVVYSTELFSLTPTPTVARPTRSE